MLCIDIGQTDMVVCFLLWLNVRNTVLYSIDKLYLIICNDVLVIFDNWISDIIERSCILNNCEMLMCIIFCRMHAVANYGAKCVSVFACHCCQTHQRLMSGLDHAEMFCLWRTACYCSIAENRFSVLLYHHCVQQILAWGRDLFCSVLVEIALAHTIHLPILCSVVCHLSVVCHII